MARPFCCGGINLAVLTACARATAQAEAILVTYLIEVDGQDTRPEALLWRSRGATSPCGKASSSARRSPRRAGIFRHACGFGLEGLVSKRIGSRYVSGRTRAWFKMKNPNSCGERQV